MGRENELAKAVVESYGQPEFPHFMLEFSTAIGGNEHVQLHMLREAGLKETMMKHARHLKSLGQKDASRDVLRDVHMRFGNSGRRKQ